MSEKIFPAICDFVEEFDLLFYRTGEIKKTTSYERVYRFFIDWHSFIAMVVGRDISKDQLYIQIHEACIIIIRFDRLFPSLKTEDV